MPTQELELAPPEADVSTLARADAPAVFEEYDKNALALITESKALTVTDSSQVAEMRLADDYRKKIKAFRCEVEKKRKEMTAGLKQAATKIDKLAGFIWDKCEQEEARLLRQAQFAEREQAERKAALKMEREAALLPLGANPAMYQLAEMGDDDFSQLLAGITAANEMKIAAEQKAKEEAAARAQAEAEERERIRLENEKLKAEAIAREAAAKAEREEAERQRVAAEATARKEREAIEAKAKAERDAIEAKARAEKEAAEAAAKKEREEAAQKAKLEREKAEAAAKIEREAREKAEAQLKAAQAAEEAKAAAAAAAAQKAAAAPDKIKLTAFAEAVRSLPVPELQTDAGKALAGALAEQTEKFAAWVEKKAATL